MCSDTQAKKQLCEIEYELNIEKYRQLHNVVLCFSNNSMEIKKLCVSTLVAVPTILFAFFKDKNITIDIIRYTCFGLLAITILFYFVDVYTYYYQKKLRDLMSRIESEMKGFPDSNIQNECDRCKNLKEVKSRLKISLINWSNLIYYILFVLLVILLIALYIHGNA